MADPLAPVTAAQPLAATVPVDDTGAGYQNYRQDTDSNALLQAARQRQQSAQPAPQPAAGQAAVPVPNQLDPAAQQRAAVLAQSAGGPAPQPPSAYQSVDTFVGSDGIPRTYGTNNGVTTLIGVGDKVVQIAKGTAAVGADMLKGATEAPRQALGGAVDAVKNTLMSMSHLGDWLNTHVADLRIPLPASMPKGISDFLSDPEKAIAGELPDIAPAKSVTGGIVRGVAQWTTAFLPIMKGLKLAEGAAGAGVLAESTPGLLANASAASGATAMTAFDPQEKNLSDLMDKFPVLKNPVTDFLHSDPNDTEAEARLKKGIEQAALGPLSEGFVMGLRALRAARAAKAAAAKAAGEEAAGGATETPPTGIAPEDASLSGEGHPAEGPLAVIQPQASQVPAKIAGAVGATETGVPEGVTAKGLQGSAGEVTPQPGKVVTGQPKVMFNYDRITDGADIRVMMQDAQEALAPYLSDAQRGTVSNAETKAAADQMGMTVEQLLARRNGQPLSASEAVAARSLLQDAAAKLAELTKAAAGPNAGPLDAFKFRKMLALYAGIKAEVYGARAETARALQSWSIPVGAGNAERERAIEMALAGNGGQDVAKALAQRLAALEASGADRATIENAMEQGAFAKSIDTVREIWINGLLSSPTTHIVNTTSNMVTAMQQVYERLAAEKVSSALGRTAGVDGVAPGEAAAYAYGMISGLKDAFRLAAKSMVTGQTGFTLGKIDIQQGAISAANYGLSEAGGFGRAVDFIGNVVRLPGRGLGAEDEFFKSIGYRSELQAQAFRQATAEGLDGAAKNQRIADIVANPPENIRMAAADQALYATFNNEPGKWADAILNLRRDVPPLALILPFVRTPANILRYATERTPFAPLLAQWRADIAAGGSRADLALARMATGSAIMAMAFDYADSGFVSGRGPSNPAQREAMRRQGWQPYSIYHNGKWYPYQRLDPMGTVLGFAADYAEYLKQGEMPDTDVNAWQQALAGGISIAAQATVNKTYLQGFANFVQMMTDPTRYSEQYTQGVISSFVPFTSGLRATEGMIDPTQRDTNGLLDQIESGLPGLSKNLTPRRDLWGQPIGAKPMLGAVGQVLSPVKPTAVVRSPIDAELTKLGYYPTRIGKKDGMLGVPIDLGNYPKAYDAYVTLAGNGLKLPQYGNKGAKDFLDAMVTGKSSSWSQIYNFQSDGPDGGKAMMIRDIIRDYRQAAARAVLNDPKFADLKALWGKRKNDADLAKMPPAAAKGLGTTALPAIP